MRTLTGECFSYVFYSIKSNVHTNLIIAASEFFSQIQFGPQLFFCRGVYTILLFWKAHAPFSGRTDVSLLSNQKRCSRLKDELLLNYSTQMYSSLYHECIFHELMCASVEYFWRNVWLSQTASGGREDGRTGGQEDGRTGGRASRRFLQPRQNHIITRPHIALQSESGIAQSMEEGKEKTRPIDAC